MLVYYVESLIKLTVFNCGLRQQHCPTGAFSQPGPDLVDPGCGVSSQSFDRSHREVTHQQALHRWLRQQTYCKNGVSSIVSLICGEYYGSSPGQPCNCCYVVNVKAKKGTIWLSMYIHYFIMAMVVFTLVYSVYVSLLG